MHDESGPKDANDALRQSLDMSQIISRDSKIYGSTDILDFRQISENIKMRIYNEDSLQGVKSKQFGFFNKTIKGYRPGELSIVSGPSGSGKTTFLSQLTLDFASSGIPTLWGSFEIKNDILGHHMFLQFNGKKITEKEHVDSTMESMCDLPLYFMNFYGSTDNKLVYETIRRAIELYDISLICLDNMQFMTAGQGFGYEIFRIQDELTSTLRRIASDYNTHVVLVIHPKKVESDDAPLGVSQIFGSSKSV